MAELGRPSSVTQLKSWNESSPSLSKEGNKTGKVVFAGQLTQTLLAINQLVLGFQMEQPTIVDVNSREKQSGQRDYLSANNKQVDEINFD